MKEHLRVVATCWHCAPIELQDVPEPFKLRVWTRVELTSFSQRVTIKKEIVFLCVRHLVELGDLEIRAQDEDSAFVLYFSIFILFGQNLLGFDNSRSWVFIRSLDFRFFAIRHDHVIET